MNDKKMHDVTTIDGEIDTRELQMASCDFACLVMIHGETIGKRFPIADQPLVIGRSLDCHIQLTDDYVSRQHCRLLPIKSGIELADLGSTNGTYVNGIIKKKYILKDGDRIRVGRNIFKFLTGANIEQEYHEEIYRLKTTDSLTGAYNKMYFLEMFERELYRFHRHQGKLALLMMDIDHFKRINDQHGHLAGDRVLAQLGEMISDSVRYEDTFARYGGEEFTLLMPEMDLHGALEVAERLRMLIDATIFEFEGLELPVTVSIGAAEVAETMQKPEDAIAIADECLYEAKSSGRNCVMPIYEKYKP